MIPGWTTATRFSAVDLEDPVHPRQRDRQAALDAGRAAGQAACRRRAARSGRDARRRGGPASATSAGLGRQGHRAAAGPPEVGASRRVRYASRSIASVSSRSAAGRPIAATDGVRQRIGDDRRPVSRRCHGLGRSVDDARPGCRMPTRSRTIAADSPALAASSPSSVAACVGAARPRCAPRRRSRAGRRPRASHRSSVAGDDRRPGSVERDEPAPDGDVRRAPADASAAASVPGRLDADRSRTHRAARSTASS